MVSMERHPLPLAHYRTQVSLFFSRTHYVAGLGLAWALAWPAGPHPLLLVTLRPACLAFLALFLHLLPPGLSSLRLGASPSLPPLARITPPHGPVWRLACGARIVCKESRSFSSLHQNMSIADFLSSSLPRTSAWLSKARKRFCWAAAGRQRGFHHCR